MLKFIVPLLSLLLTVPAFAKDPIRTITGTVTKVTDGDTVNVFVSGSKLRVRLYGIDAPETEKVNRRTGRISKQGQPYGEEAKQALQAKVGGKTVKVDVMDIDRYHRAVAVISIGVRDINREMVAEGWAWAYRQYLDRPHASEYLGAEDRARRARLGIWQQGNPQPPWEFRKAMRVQ